MNRIFALALLFFSFGLQCMEAESEVEQETVSLANEGEPLTGFPDYMYYYSAWSNLLEIKGLPIGALATPSLAIAATHIENKTSRQEALHT